MNDGMASGWRAGLHVALMSLIVGVVFVTLSSAGTDESPYAPNDWLFSHHLLAEKGIENRALPFNHALFVRHSFDDTVDDFTRDTGLDRLSLYATTTWHFWNGLPLHSALLAGTSLLIGESVESTSRIPLPGLAILGVLAASADVFFGTTRPRSTAALFVPLVAAIASAPFLLDMRVTMPSATLLIVGILLHFLLRAQLLDDRRAYVVALAPIALLPFWYYTMAYFVMALFAGLFVVHLLVWLLRMRGAPVSLRPLVPWWLALAVPAVLGAVLLLNGALTSHLEMASRIGATTLFGPEAGVDYTRRLNRVPWRSAAVYAATVLFFAPLGAISLRAAYLWLRGRPVGRVSSFVAQWSLGGLFFGLILQLSVGVSFLNRDIIYLTPIGALAAVAYVSSARWRPARLVATPVVAVIAALAVAVVATAAPFYGRSEEAAFDWVAGEVSPDTILYGSLDTSSILFRTYGYHDVVAFHPHVELFDRFWYAEDPEQIAPYIQSFRVFVLRAEAARGGFEEFGPLRAPISPEALAKFSQSSDLQRVYDNGEVFVFFTSLSPDRFA